MRQLFKYLLLILSLFFINYTYAENQLDKPTLVWKVGDLPPGLCHKTKTEVPCFVNFMVAKLKEKLTNYEHQDAPMMIKRLLQEFKKADRLVITGALSYTDERQKFVEFSYTVPFPRLPYVIAIRKDNLNLLKPYLNSDEKVDFEKLMASPLRTLLYEGRSYKYLNTVINKYKANKQSLSNYTTLIGMRFLALKRIEFLIIYPPHASFAQRQIKVDEFEVLTYPIIGSKPYIASRMGTVKSEEGKKLIKQINELLYDKAIITSTTKNYRAWLPENLKPYYDKISKQYQIERREIDGLK